jgi:hypothetical protein
MNRLRMTSAASSLCRALLDRAGADKNRILLSAWVTIDWQSLTFNGERHRAGFVITGKDASALAARWTGGIGEAEFDLGPAGFVAEIALAGPPTVRDDGAIQVDIEALTIAD